MTTTPQPFQGRTKETTTEEREERKRFWRTITKHDPPLMADFEARLLRDYDRLEAERDTLTTQLREMEKAFNDANGERKALRLALARIITSYVQAGAEKEFCVTVARQVLAEERT